MIENYVFGPNHNFGGSVKKYLLNIGADIGDAFIGLDMCSSSFYTTL